MFTFKNCGQMGKHVQARNPAMRSVVIKCILL